MDVFTRLTVLSFFLCFLVTSGIAQTYEVIPLTQPGHRLGEHEWEKETFPEIDSTFLAMDSSGYLRNDPELIAYIYGITDRLLPGKREELGWKVFVADDITVNASAYANGNILICTGLLQRMQNEAELAFVLAHEMAHFINRHSLQLAVYQESIKEELRPEPYSADVETEADTVGLALYLGAGYPAACAVSGMKRLPPEMNLDWMIGSSFLKSIFNWRDSERSHPRTPDRIALLDQLTSGYSSNPGNPIDTLYDRLTSEVNDEVMEMLLQNAKTYGAFPLAIRLIDTILTDVETNDSTPYTLKLNRMKGDALVNLLCLPPRYAMGQITNSVVRGQVGDMTAEEEESLSRIKLFNWDKEEYPGYRATWETQLKEVLRVLDKNPAYAYEASRLRGTHLYNAGEDLSTARVELLKYLDSSRPQPRARFVRSLLRDIDARTKSKKRKR